MLSIFLSFKKYKEEGYIPKDKCLLEYVCEFVIHFPEYFEP